MQEKRNIANDCRVYDTAIDALPSAVVSAVFNMIQLYRNVIFPKLTGRMPGSRLAVGLTRYTTPRRTPSDTGRSREEIYHPYRDNYISQRPQKMDSH